MKLSEDTYIDQIKKLKKEIVQLKQDLTQNHPQNNNTLEKLIKDKRNTEIFNFLSSTATRMLGTLNLTELFRFVSDQLYSIAGGAMICFNEFDSLNQKVIVRELRCTAKEREKIINIIGREPEGLVFDFPEETRNRIIPGGLEYLEGGFSELVFGQLPDSLCKEFEKDLNVVGVYAMTCAVENDIMGTVAIFAHESPVPNNYLIESVVNHTALVLKRKRSEEALHESEEKFSAAFRSNPNALVLSYEENGRIIDVNDTFLRLFECTKEETIGKSFLSLNMFDDPKDWDKAILILRKERRIINFETKIKSRSGKEHIVLLSAELLYIKHGKAILATIQDVTVQKRVEERLRENEERFRTLADNISQMAWIVDDQGKPVWFNKRWFDYTGVRLEESQKVVHPDYWEQILINFQEARNHGKPWEQTYPMKSKEGEFRWFLTRALPIHDENGKITLWFGTNTDVTEQRKIEEALRESEQRLQGMFDNAAIGIVEVDQKDQFIAVNDRICKILGYTREQMLGKPVQEITAPEDLPHSRKINHKLHIGELDMFDFEKRYIKSDGSYLWVHVSVSAVRDLQGQHIRTIRTIEDITARKIAEEALRESEEKFRSLFENITEGVALYEIVYENDNPVNYRIIDANPAFIANCGIDANKAIGSLGSELYGTTQPPMFFKEYLEVSQTLQPYRFEAFFPAMNKHFLINVISPQKDHFATVFEDITEQKINELEIKQKNEELTRFIYTVSHDLKSPLVTIKSFASYLKEDIQSEDKTAQDKDIAYIQNAADKMGKLLDELLTLSRIGRKEEPKTEVSLNDIAQAALDLVAGRISKIDAKISMVGPPVMLYGHSQRLLQLYQNLLDNAVKFMGDQPEPLVEIGTLFDSNRNEVVLFVRDNGSGIDPQYHHKLFGLFEKLDNNTEGTGIGLALIKRIVEVHGGSIWFNSEGTGKGTIFYFTLEKTYIIK